MGYKIKLNAVDRERLAELLKLAEHLIEFGIDQNAVLRFTGEDIALSQKLRKALGDTTEFLIILDK